MAHSKGEKNSTESFPEKDQINCIKDAQELQEDMEKVKRTIYEQNRNSNKEGEMLKREKTWKETSGTVTFVCNSKLCFLHNLQDDSI